MAVLVQKYGGTSVGSIERIKKVAKRIIKSKKEGYQVVVVVSAMSGVTDRLTSLAHKISKEPHIREMDMLLSTGEQVSISLLAMALDSMGHKAVSMTGSQVGIQTDSVYTNARIQSIETSKLKSELKKGNIIIVAGFQGIDENNNVTTLGRGGSDTSAVALAAALKAKYCEIYTDVDGVYTADPNKVKAARKLNEICYEEMLELASLGAKVLHSRSVEIAMNFNVVLHIRSSLNNKKGTLVIKESKAMEKIVINGVTSKTDEARVNIAGVPDKPGIAADIFNDLAGKNINVDMIVQSTSPDGKTNSISFTVKKKDLTKVKGIMQELKKRNHAGSFSINQKIGIVSIVGVGMKSHAGIAGKMFDVLAKSKINIEMISTSEIKISVVIEETKVIKAMNIIHKAFDLN